MDPPMTPRVSPRGNNSQHGGISYHQRRCEKDVKKCVWVTSDVLLGCRGPARGDLDWAANNRLRGFLRHHPFLGVPCCGIFNRPSVSANSPLSTSLLPIPQHAPGLLLTNRLRRPLLLCLCIDQRASTVPLCPLI